MLYTYINPSFKKKIYIYIYIGTACDVQSSLSNHLSDLSVSKYSSICIYVLSIYIILYYKYIHTFEYLGDFISCRPTCPPGEAWKPCRRSAVVSASGRSSRPVLSPRSLRLVSKMGVAWCRLHSRSDACVYTLIYDDILINTCRLQWRFAMIETGCRLSSCAVWCTG